MALFKVLRGPAATIDKTNPSKPPFVDGYAYFTPDDGRFYIDVQLDTTPGYYYDMGTVNGKNIYRIEMESGTMAQIKNTKTDIGHHHSRTDIDDFATLTVSTASGDFTYDGTVDVTIPLDWNLLLNKPTIINVAITVDDNAKTLFITSPVTNGDGVSY